MLPDDALSISWSSLRSFSECKQKGYLQKNGFKSPATDIRGYFHGTVSDRVMRKWLESEDRRLGQMAGWVDELIDTCIADAKESGEGVVRWKSTSDRAEMRDYCIELVRRLEPILEELVLPYQFQSATRFKVPVQVPWLDGSPTWIYLVGEFDIVTYSSGYAVWDLKATKDDQYWRKTIGQLTFYDLAIGAMYEEFTEKVGLIQPMCKERVLDFKVTDDDRNQMWSRIHRMSTDLWLKEYAPKADSVGCAYCAVKHGCAKFKNVKVTANGKRKMSFGGGLDVGLGIGCQADSVED